MNEKLKYIVILIASSLINMIILFDIVYYGDYSYLLHLLVSSIVFVYISYRLIRLKKKRGDRND